MLLSFFLGVLQVWQFYKRQRVLLFGLLVPLAAAIQQPADCNTRKLNVQKHLWEHQQESDQVFASNNPQRAGHFWKHLWEHQQESDQVFASNNPQRAGHF